MEDAELMCPECGIKLMPVRQKYVCNNEQCALFQRPVLTCCD